MSSHSVAGPAVRGMIVFPARLAGDGAISHMARQRLLSHGGSQQALGPAETQSVRRLFPSDVLRDSAIK